MSALLKPCLAVIKYEKDVHTFYPFFFFFFFSFPPSQRTLQFSPRVVNFPVSVFILGFPAYFFPHILPVAFEDLRSGRAGLYGARPTFVGIGLDAVAVKL